MIVARKTDSFQDDGRLIQMYGSKARMIRSRARHLCVAVTLAEFQTTNQIGVNHNTTVENSI